MKEKSQTNENLHKIMDRRIKKDHFLLAFIWLLIIEFLIAIVYPLVDIIKYQSFQNSLPLKTFIHTSLTFSFIFSFLIGLVCIGMAFFKIKINIFSKKQNPKIYTFGVFFVIFLLIFLLVMVWLTKT